MNLIGTILVYAALTAMFLGCVSVVRPLRFLGITSRPFGIVVLLCGVIFFMIGANLPAPENRIAARTTNLDDFMPAYQFAEFHSLRIKTSRERVFVAIRQVTADEITLFRTLTWIRRFGRPGPESILNAPADKPLLDVATRTSFMKLAEEPDREIVVGTLLAAPKGTRLKKDPTPDDFKALHAPGFALGALNFRLEDAANGETVLTTETRVYATDSSTKKKFGGYWRVIYPGSALIRVMWLRAIRKRAEGGGGLSAKTLPQAPRDRSRTRWPPPRPGCPRFRQASASSRLPAREAGQSAPPQEPLARSLHKPRSVLITVG